MAGTVRWRVMALWSGAVVALLAGVYSCSGVLMTGSFAAASGIPEQYHASARLWSYLMYGSFLATVGLVLAAIKVSRTNRLKDVE